MTPVSLLGLQPAYLDGDTARSNKKSRSWQELLWAQVCDYCENTTLHGYRYLTEPGRHWVERLLWVVIHLLATWGVTFIILDVWREYTNSPTVTTVDSTTYPIWNVSFPAIAVCNINKISKSAAWNLAQNLSKTGNISADELFSMTQYLGRLYDHDPDNIKKIEKLHSILLANNPDYDVDSTMKSLTPKCEELILRCRWMGKVKNCSEIFEFRKSMEGYCCTFNYIRTSDNFDNHEVTPVNVTEPKTARAPGYNMGLTVLVDPQPEDYYYPLLASYGTKVKKDLLALFCHANHNCDTPEIDSFQKPIYVLVFNPREFPDTPSGGLIEKLVPPRTEVFFRLEATSVYAVPNVINFDRKQRGCLFARTTRTCDLMDIPCLYKYREKWSTLRPTEEIQGLEAEMQESITCEQCYPTCSDTTYHVQTSSAELSQTPYVRSGLVENMTLKNHSVFHIYFGSKNTVRFKQDVLYYWYDLLSNFGGICGLFVGFSLISIVEFVYFFTLRLFFVAEKDSRKTLTKLEKYIKVMKKLREESVPQWLQKENPLALNNRLLSYCGLLPANTDSMKRVNMIICTTIIILTVTMMTGAFIQAYFSHTNFMAFIECGTVCITQLKCLIKFAVMLIYSKDLRFVINNLKENFYVHENMFKNEIISKIKVGKRAAWWITVPYTSLFIGTIGLIAAEKILAQHRGEKLSVAANGTNITETFHRKLPLKIWLPVEEETSPSYEIGFVYQIVCFTIEIYSTCIIDTFIVVLIMFAAIQYELLGMAIQLPVDTVAMRLGINTAPLQGTLLDSLRGHVAKCRVTGDLTEIQPHHLSNAEQTISQMVTVQQKNEHFPAKSRPGLSDIVVTSIDNAEGNMTTRSAEYYRQEVDTYFGRCVERHQSLLKYIEHLNVLSSPIQFLQALTSSLLICTLGFTAIVSGNAAVLPKVLMYAFDALLQIGLPCWFATKLRVQGERIAEAAYACEWYNEPVSFQRSVSLVMMRAQRPVILKLGPFGTLSLELFAAVVQSAYSYLTLLRQLYAGP